MSAPFASSAAFMLTIPMMTRHALLQWLNGTKDDVPVTKIVQLTCQAGYYEPVVTCTDTTIRNQVIPVGTFSRAQRDQILLANQIKFQKTSIINNCRVWLRELLVAMVDGELITQVKLRTASKEDGEHWAPDRE